MGVLVRYSFYKHSRYIIHTPPIFTRILNVSDYSNEEKAICHGITECRKVSDTKSIGENIMSLFLKQVDIYMMKQEIADICISLGVLCLKMVIKKSI